MVEIKQTPVEWLVEQLENNATMDYSFAQAHKLIMLDVYTFTKLFEQAKALEKQQIMIAYEQGDIQLVNSNQYYNETYGKADSN
jgi:hypothetical protein